MEVRPSQRARYQLSLKNRDSHRRSAPATIPTSQSPYHKKPLGFILIPGETISPIMAIVGPFGGKSRAIFDLFGLSVRGEIRTPEFSCANQADEELSSTLVVGVNSANQASPAAAASQRCFAAEPAAQVVGQRLARGITPVRLLGHSLLADSSQGSGNSGIDCPGGRGIVMDRMEEDIGRGSEEWRLTTQGLVKNCPQAVLVAGW